MRSQNCRRRKFGYIFRPNDAVFGKILPLLFENLWKGNSLDISRWKCASEVTKTTTTTTVTTPTGITGNTRGTTAAPTTTEPVRYRIPPNLSCKKNDRIINGVEAIENSWPWIVRMSFGAFMCGGTILSENLIVTAAHCCASASNRPDRIKAFIGDHNRKVSTPIDHMVLL